MILKNIFLYVAICLTFILEADEKLITPTVEIVSYQKVLNYPRYSGLNNFDPGCFKTILRLSRLPKNHDFLIKWKRPLLIKNQRSEKIFSFEQLKMNGEILAEKTPIFIISSRGFMPGEKIYLSIEALDGKPISEEVSFIPYPIAQKTINGNGMIMAELTILTPTTYKIILEGVSHNEKLYLISKSSGERIKNNFRYNKNHYIAISPGVLGKKGGLGNLSITGEKGGQFSLTLPWGMELIKHLDGN